MDSVCQGCPLSGHKCISGGKGSQPADYVVVGQGPDLDELVSDKPFFGEQEAILRSTLKAAGINPDRVWYTTAVKCYTGHDKEDKLKVPTSAQYLACRQRLLDEIKSCGASKIIAMGGVALSAVLGATRALPITKNRGLGMIFEMPKEMNLNGSSRKFMVPTYLPSAVLADPDLWRDFGNDIYKVVVNDQPRPIPTPEMWLPKSVDDAIHYLDIIFEASRLSCDLETEGFDFLVDDILSIGFGALVKGDVEKGVSLILTRDLINDPDVKQEIIWKMERFTGAIVFHNIKFDLKFFQSWLGRPLRLKKPMDSMLMNYMLDERPFNRYPVHSLKTMARVRYDIPDYHFDFDEWLAVPPDQRDWMALYKYHALDCYCTIRLMTELWNEIEEDSKSLFTALEEVLIPGSLMMAEVEYWGVLIDIPYFEKMKIEIEAKLAVLTLRLKDFAVTYAEANPDKFNPNSPIQIAKIFSKRDIVVENTEREGLQALERQLREEGREAEANFVADLLDFRQWSKVYSTYVVGLLGQVAVDGRVHSDFLLHGTATGRLSSNNPNLQNIPTLMGKDIRRGFLAPEGSVIIEADYSQLELRVAALLSGDESLLEAYRTGQDVHKLVASMMYKKPVEEITWLERYMAKYIDFGIIYGRGAKSLVEGWEMEHYVSVLGGTRWTLEEAESFIEEFLKGMSGLKDWIEFQHEWVRDNGYVKTPFGRRRRFPFRTNRSLWAIQRQAVNSPIQSTASDLCLTAMTRLHKRFNQPIKTESEEVRQAIWKYFPIPKEEFEWRSLSQFGVHILFSVHDAIYFEVPEDWFDVILPIIQYEMAENLPRQIPRDRVPFRADVKVGINWGDAHEPRGDKMKLSSDDNVLVALRLMAGLPQTRLAQMLGISQPQLSFYEGGLRIPEYRGEQILEVLKEQLGVRFPPEITSPDQLLLPWSKIIPDLQVTNGDHA